MGSGRTIVCAHQFPEDLVWEEDEDCEEEIADLDEVEWQQLRSMGGVPPGRVIAQAVRGMLQERGYACGKPKIDAEHCSWSLFPERDRKSYYVYVCATDDELIVSVDTQPNGCLGFFALPFRKVPPELPQYLFDSFNADPRFGRVAWQD